VFGKLGVRSRPALTALLFHEYHAAGCTGGSCGSPPLSSHVGPARRARDDPRAGRSEASVRSAVRQRVTVSRGGWPA
jgi:hypothetical protein